MTEFSFPGRFVLPVPNPLLLGDLTVDIVTGYVYSTGTLHQKNVGLRGGTDTKIRGIWAMADDQFMVRLGLSLPRDLLPGVQNEVSMEKLPLIEQLNKGALNFEIDPLGKGFDVDVGIGMAKEVDSGWAQFVLGGGVILV